MIYLCCDQKRRAALRDPQQNPSGRNGIDYLEVVDREATPESARQKVLEVRFIHPLTAGSLGLSNVIIEGGERIRNPRVTAVEHRAGDEAEVLTVEVEQPGDYSTYTLRLIRDTAHPEPPDGYDPALSAVEFSFKVECPSEFDCRPRRVCPPAPRVEPEIDYLAKDFASLRRLLLDRLSVVCPQWQERNPADLGVALVELLAYVGDYLSYQQDAVATEAYLGTARRRVSVRRHARLVDYVMHDGCNARTCVQVRVDRDTTAPLPAGTRLFTRTDGQPEVMRDDSTLGRAQAVFETMFNVPRLYVAHNSLSFYTWSDQRCCLPRGATRATLAGHFPNLMAGDVLIFEEVIGPRTGRAEDANPAHRQAVRLTHVVSTNGPSARLADPVTTQDITTIEWDEADALTFPLCLSARTDAAHGGRYLPEVSVALGNIVLADHGLTVNDAPVPAEVPHPHLFRLPTQEGDPCREQESVSVPPRYRPRLPHGPLTFAVPIAEAPRFDLELTDAQERELNRRTLPASLRQHFRGQGVALADAPSIQGQTPEWSVSDGKRAFRLRKESRAGITRLLVYPLLRPAGVLLQQQAAEALPDVNLTGQIDDRSEPWEPRQDLLDSDPTAREFVVEVEEDGLAWLRFGDGEFGRRPAPGTAFTARYRVGNGQAGNLGAGSLGHIVTTIAGVTGVRHPLPAIGGTEPETIEQVPVRAPAAFRTQERAVTEADYAEVTARDPEVQRAAGTFRWTGSWHTAFVTVDRFGGKRVDDRFRQRVREGLERYRMARYDLEVDAPRFVSLEIEMHVCVHPDYLRSDVKAALLDVFSNGTLPDGQRGLFHPDLFSFGQTVDLSPFIAAAQAVPGVASVHVRKFQRQGLESEALALVTGRIGLERLEIARLDNDPNFPEHGVFRLTLGGGR